MFAERADEIFRKVLALVNVSADLADPAFLAFGLGLRLNICLIVGVGHRVLVADHAGFGDGAEEHAVRAEIDVILDFKGHEGVDVLPEEDQAVVRTEHFLAGELVDCAAGAEAEILKDLERCFDREAVHVHLAGLLDNVVRVVLLLDADRDHVRRRCDLGNGIDNQAVVFRAVV